MTPRKPLEMTRTCQCCEQEFQYLRNPGPGRARALCDACLSVGVVMGTCECGRKFMHNGRQTRCEEHRDRYEMTCLHCGEAFIAKRDTAFWCAKHKRRRHREPKPVVIVKPKEQPKPVERGCSSCYYAIRCESAWNGYQCAAGLARSCKPELDARHYKAREEKVG